FFSTRLIPGPVLGNTPLIRVPLVSPEALAQDAADKRRRTELEREVPTAADHAYRAFLKQLVVRQTARYLTTACAYRQRASGPTNPSLKELAKEYGLHESLLAGWVAFLGRVEKQPPESIPVALRNAANGKLTGLALRDAADKLQQTLTATAVRIENEPPEKQPLTRGALLRLRADDPQLATDSAGRVTLWPNRSRHSLVVRPPAREGGPVKTTALIAGHKKTVLRFDGRALLEAPIRAPVTGSVFVVFQRAEKGSPGQRLIGWEDANVGHHGLGLMLDTGGRLHVILRKHSQTADLVHVRRTTDF